MKKVFLVLTAALLLSSCSGWQEPSYEVDAPVQVQALGDVFVTSPLKIKATATDNSYDPARVATIELYVDSNGNGSGMFGIGDSLCDVKAVNNNLYLIVDGDNVVMIGDVTPRMIWAGTQVSGSTDLASLGFMMSGNVPTGYLAQSGSVVLSSQYASSTQSFEAVNLTPASTLSMQDAMGYVLDYFANKSGETDSSDGESTEVVQDFYTKSRYAVTIGGVEYSIGDTCNPDTYFGSVPEGLLTSSSYKEDERIEFLHVSYLTEDGRTVFVLNGNYVQSIETTSEFEWLGLYKGMETKEVQQKLGSRLTKKELETFVPLDPDLVVEKTTNSNIKCSLGNLSIELRCAGGKLDSIFIERQLAYK